MTEREIKRKFLSTLDTNQYDYRLEGEDEKIIVTHEADVYLGMTDFIPNDLEFRNKGEITLSLLRNIPVGVEFNNEGDVYLGRIIGIGYMSLWEGNIEGIESKRLLNLMISRGLFI